MAIDLNSSSVQSYLGILQSIINRMATNSSACKTWCVGLTSAILVVVADKKRPELALVGLLPLVLFVFLDSYYLALERRFRASFIQFIKNVQAGTAKPEELFLVDPNFGVRTTPFDTFKATTSVAIWPFYSLLFAMLLVVRYLVL